MSKLCKAGLLLAASGLAASPLGAPVLASGHPWAASLIRDFFSGLCHQNPERSLVVCGAPVAVCVRCLGIYFGVALGGWLPAGKTFAMRCLAIGVLLNLADAVTAWMNWHGNLPLSRFLLGLLLGLGAGVLLFQPMHHAKIRCAKRDRVSLGR